TLPVPTASLASAVLQVAAVGMLLSWLISATAIVILLSITVAHDARNLLDSRNFGFDWATAWWLALGGVSWLLVAWTVVGLVTSAALTGRKWVLLVPGCMAVGLTVLAIV